MFKESIQFSVSVARLPTFACSLFPIVPSSILFSLIVHWNSVRWEQVQSWWTASGLGEYWFLCWERPFVHVPGSGKVNGEIKVDETRRDGIQGTEEGKGEGGHLFRCAGMQIQWQKIKGVPATWHMFPQGSREWSKLLGVDGKIAKQHWGWESWTWGGSNTPNVSLPVLLIHPGLGGFSKRVAQKQKGHRSWRFSKIFVLKDYWIHIKIRGKSRWRLEKIEGPMDWAFHWSRVTGEEGWRDPTREEKATVIDMNEEFVRHGSWWS